MNLTLTNQQRKDIVVWLNSESSDGVYNLEREDGEITTFHRQTVNTTGGKWKVRLAFEAESGYPVAMGSPIQTSQVGKLPGKPGQATLKLKPTQQPGIKLLTPAQQGPMSAKDKYHAELYGMGPAKLVPGPTYNWQPGGDFVIVDDQSNMNTVEGLTLHTKHGPVTLAEGNEYSPGFVKEYDLLYLLKNEPNWQLIQSPAKMAWIFVKKSGKSLKAFEDAATAPKPKGYTVKNEPVCWLDDCGCDGLAHP